MPHLTRRAVLALILAAPAVLPAGPVLAQSSPEILHSFDGRTTARYPHVLIAGADGNMYGMSREGGTLDHGTVFRITPDGLVSIVHSFAEGVGYGSSGTLVQGADGALYGTTDRCFFRLTTAGDFQVVNPFPTGGEHMVQGSDGNFYAVSVSGGAFNRGAFTRITPSGEVTLLASFGTDASNYPHLLIQGSDGNFWGTTGCEGCGPPEGGTIFKVTPAGVLTIEATGHVPWALVQASDGSFFGVTAHGGEHGRGQVFRFVPGNPIATIYSFTGGADGRAPVNLTIADDGNLYGATLQGGEFGRGALFKVTPAGAVQVLRSLNVTESVDTIVQGTDGRLYALLPEAGPGFTGGALRFFTNGTFDAPAMILSGPDGAYPAHRLVQAADGNVYGTTTRGGMVDVGTVFRMAPDGLVTPIHAFTGGADGAFPSSPLIAAGDGGWYGTTDGPWLPASTSGTIFHMTPNGTVTTVAILPGRDPNSVLLGSDGNLYGTSGRPYGPSAISIFRVTPSGAVTILRDFNPPSDYISELVEGADGRLYGITGGYAPAPASLFRMDRDGTSFTTLATFPAIGHYDNIVIPDGLVRGIDGNLYGPMPSLRQVIRVGMDGTVTVLHQFEAGSPSALTLAPDGQLFGLLSSRIFRLGMDGNAAFIEDVPPYGSYGYSKTTLAAGADGYLYGTTTRGGIREQGTVFRLRPPATPPQMLTVAPRGDGSITLSWRRVFGASSYTVKRRTANGSELVVATALTSDSFVDATVTRGEHYYYVVTATNALGESLNSYEVSATAGRAALGDFDGDRRADVSLFRPSTGTWHLIASSAGFGQSVTWGDAGDIPAAGDYDGDGRIDVAVFRPSASHWYVRSAATGAMSSYVWGGTGDIPVPADYDGDARTDIAIFRPSTGVWYVRHSRDFTTAAYLWGGGGDKPVPADYDGDGRADVAVFRPSNGTWYVRASASQATVTYVWGGEGDAPVPGDYDSDGRTDVGVFRPSTGYWYIRPTTTQSGLSILWGGGDDVPVPADYDADGQTDAAIFRPSTGAWYIRLATGAMAQYTWGGTGDIPILKAP
jgi:uncharacterized repeat protein (TIGR03803 family)